MKKVLSILLAVVLCFSVCAMFTGCGKEAKTYVVLEEDFGGEEYGIGFRNEDVALGLEVQKQLDAMIEDGTAAEISKKWFAEDIIYVTDQYVEPEVTVSDDDTSLQDILDKGKIVIGLDDSFPPMGYRDENNEIVGFDIDLAKEVAKRMGIEVEFQSIDWDSKELELSTGKIDALWNGMTITDERIDAMYFAKPYLKNRQIVIVAEDSGITSKADLEGKVIGLQKGSSSLEAFEADKETSASVASVEQYADNVTAFMDLKAGRIDAFVVDEVVGRYIMENN